VREKYCWLVADKLNEQSESCHAALSRNYIKCDEIDDTISCLLNEMRRTGYLAL
jgi:hypothetical protein